MAYRLIVSKEADKDIDDFVHYIAVELANPPAAASFLGDVEESYNAVVNNPRMYSANRVRLEIFTKKLLVAPGLTVSLTPGY